MAGGQAYRAVWGLLQELWCHPAFCAGNARVETEATTACRELLAEAKVGNDHSALTLAVRPSHENVARLQVTVYYRKEGESE